LLESGNALFERVGSLSDAIERELGVLALFDKALGNVVEVLVDRPEAVVNRLEAEVVRLEASIDLVETSEYFGESDVH
jgi:hypothetical protein